MLVVKNWEERNEWRCENQFVAEPTVSIMQVSLERISRRMFLRIRLSSMYITLKSHA